MKRLDLSKLKTIEKRLPSGAYVCKIIKAIDNSKYKNLEVYLDVVEGDYADYYTNRGEKSGQKKAKWFYPKITLWYDEESPYAESNLQNFKQMITSLKNSNEGYDFEESYDEEELVDRLVGVIFRDEEFLTSDGQVKSTSKPVFFRSVDSVRNDDIPIMKPKLLKTNKDEDSVKAEVKPKKQPEPQQELPPDFTFVEDDELDDIFN